MQKKVKKAKIFSLLFSSLLFYVVKRVTPSVFKGSSFKIVYKASLSLLSEYGHLFLFLEKGCDTLFHKNAHQNKRKQHKGEMPNDMIHVRMDIGMSLKNEEPRKRPGERNPQGGYQGLTFRPRALLERELYRRFGFIPIENVDIERRLDLPFCRLQEISVIESSGLHVINNNCTIVVFF